jgi:hypothetical protein
MYENLPELKSGRYYSRILGKPDKIRILRSTLLKTELFCLNSFTYKWEERRSVLRRLEEESTMEILCWRFKEGTLG